jgi:hypothetical protein
MVETNTYKSHPVNRTISGESLLYEFTCFGGKPKRKKNTEKMKIKLTKVNALIKGGKTPGEIDSHEVAQEILELFSGKCAPVLKKG